MPASRERALLSQPRISRDGCRIGSAAVTSLALHESSGRRRAPRLVAPAGRVGADRNRQPAARPRRPRLGDRRVDRQRRQGLHPRQRRRGVAPSRRRDLERRHHLGRRRRQPGRRRRSRGRSLRPRDGLRRRRPRACARRRDPLGARDRRRLLGLRQGARRRPSVGRRAGLRHRQHEPLDDEAQLRRDPARARRHRVLQPLDPRRLRAQHAGRVLPVALLLGRSPSAATRRPTRSSSTRTRIPRSSSSRAASTSTSRGSAAARSARPATASRRPPSPASPRSCWASIHG